MKKRFLFSMCMMALLLSCLIGPAGAADVVASGYCGGEGDGTNLSWSLDSDGVLTITGSGYMQNYPRVDSAPWHSLEVKQLVLSEGILSIGQSAFWRCTTLSGPLTLPDSLLSIAEDAFYNCSGLTGSLVIPNSVTTVGKSAFYGCSGLTGTLTIGSSVTEIGQAAFYQCSGFTGDLVIPDSVTKLGDHAFFDCSGFDGTLTIGKNVPNIGQTVFLNCSGFTGDLVIPDSVTAIGDEAFEGCSGFSGSLVIGDGVTSIASEAFNGCSGFTGTLTLGENISSIGWRAFYGCSGFTGSLIIPDSVTTLDSFAFYGCSGFDSDLILSSRITSIPSYTFCHCSGFSGTLTLCPGLTSIGDCAFYGCSSFTGDLIIPDNVTTINSYAFYGCSGFDGDLVIGNGVTAIDPSVFENCSGFRGDLIIGDGLTSIDTDTFSSCSNMSGKLVIGNSVATIAPQAFSGFKYLTGDLIIPDSVTEIGYEAFYDCCGFDGKLTLSANLTSISGSAFGNCSGLTGSLIIPDSVTEIRSGAFSSCSGLSGKLLIGDSVTYIDSYAFSNCSGLSGDLMIPDNVTEIGSRAFYGCSGFNGDLIIGNGVTDIGQRAFDGCTGFRGDLTIGDGLTYINGLAFTGIAGFTGRLSLGKNITVIGENAFSGLSDLTGELVLPSNITSIGTNAFLNCSGFTGSLVIPETVTTIDPSAFSGCSGFTGDLVIPDGVTYLGNRAFYGCSGFDGTLTLGGGLTEIRDSTFAGCSGFTGSLLIPGNISSIGSFAFSDTGFDGTLIIPYSITTIPQGAFFANFHTLYLPSSINTLSPYSKCNEFNTVDTIYYGGTSQQWYNLVTNHFQTFKNCTLKGFQHIYYDAYSAKSLNILSGASHVIKIGETHSLKADYCTDENASVETADLTWTSSNPSVLKITNTSQTAVHSGYYASSSITFEAVGEGTATVTVSAGGLSDSCSITVTDLKELVIIPEDSWEDGTILLAKGGSTTVQARYRTSGSAADEMSTIHWDVSFPEDTYIEEGVDASDIVFIVETGYAIGDTDTSAIVTATIQAIDYGGPIVLSVSGLSESGDEVPVYVPDKKITILESSSAEVPAEPTVQYFHVKAAEEFKVHMLYETMGDIEEELANFSWGLTTENFMAEPEDGTGDPCDENLYSAAPIELTWRERETGKYTVSATFLPAVTGVTALKVEAADFVSDSCIVYAEFDEYVFWANQYQDSECLGAAGIQNILFDIETPSDIFVRELQKSGDMAFGANAWSSLSDAFAIAKDVTHLYDMVIREEDLYLAMLLDILQNYSEDVGDTFFRDLQTTLKTANDSITDAVKAVYGYDLRSPVGYKKFIVVEKNRVILEEVTKDVCADQFACMDSISKIMTGLDLGLTTITTLDEVEDKVIDDLLVAQLCDSMKSVVHAMYDACILSDVENNALRTALKECVDMVDRTVEDVLEKQITDGVAIVGERVALEAIRYVWKSIKAGAELATPCATMLVAYYDVNKAVCNELFATDATLEEYYKMLIIREIRRVATLAHDELFYQFQLTESSEDAQAYLACIDFLFSAIDKDCITAYYYVDNLSKSVADNLAVIFGDTTTGDAKDSIMHIRRDRQTQWTNSYVFWINYLPDGPLQHYYEDLYFPIFGFPVWRETVACPVDVYVYNSRDELVAWVERNEVSCTTDDLTITRNGDEKIITCYSGAGYSIRYAGTDSGEMDIIWEEFGSDGSVTRTVNYYDVPLTDGSEHTSSDTFTLDGLNPNLDTDIAETYTITMAFGMTGLDADSMFTAKVPAGALIPIYAHVADDSVFTGWTSDQGTELFDDPTSPITTLRMPAADVTVTAQLRRPDDTLPVQTLTVSDSEGYLLSRLPDSKFTVRVVVEDDNSDHLFAAYDVTGRMLELLTPEVQNREDGSILLSFTWDNTDGKIEMLKFFQLKLTDGLKPVGAAQRISA